MNQDFKIAIPITRAYKKGDDYYIEGVASSTDVDSYETVFNRNCQEGFAIDINSGFGTDDPVVIEVEHQGDMNPLMVIGVIERAHVDENNQLNIVARLDKDNPNAVYYHKLLTDPDPKLGRPKQLGLSINGFVKEAHREFNEKLNKTIDVFDRVILKKVGIVRSPSNPSTWVKKLQRSVNQWNVLKENVMEDNQNVETVTETEVQETVTEVTETEVQTEVVETTEVETTETRAEEVAQVEDSVVRSDVWSAMDVMTAFSGILNGVARIEWLLEDQKWRSTLSEADVTTCRDSLGKLDGVMKSLLGVLGNVSTPDMDDPEATERSAIENEVDVTVKVTENVTEAVRSMIDEVKSELTRAMDEKIAELKTANDEVVRKLSDAESKNEELVQRLAKVEAQPASVPGAPALGDEIVRSITTEADTKAQEFAEKVKRTKQDILDGKATPASLIELLLQQGK